MSASILLIDDDADFLMATSLVLKKNGYEVHTACNGRDGLRLSTEIPFDLIIVDLMMDTWSEGYDVVANLREKIGGGDTPIIILSSVDLAGPYDAFDYAKFNVDCVLRKPIRTNDLLGHVKTLIEK